MSIFKSDKKPEGEVKADKAIAMADGLISEIRNLNGHEHTIKSMISDIWVNRHNTPFLVTVFEAIQEVKINN